MPTNRPDADDPWYGSSQCLDFVVVTIGTAILSLVLVTLLPPVIPEPVSCGR